MRILVIVPEKQALALRQQSSLPVVANSQTKSKPSSPKNRKLNRVRPRLSVVHQNQRESM
jgi:hypothetical protein